MSYTVNLQKRIQELKKKQADLPAILENVARRATEDAIQAAKDATPPKAGTGRDPYRGENTVSGALKSHWGNDSITEPMGTALSGGTTYTTVLGNNLDYASYVDKGHRMDEHFVPGLYVDPRTGILTRNPDGKGGIVVGTKTKYVKGEFIADKGKAAYEESVLKQLDMEIKKLIK